jgi:hypothetical protein
MVQGFLIFLMALVIMTLAAFGAGSLTTAATQSHEQPLYAGFGVFFLLGAFFLYRAWFMRR